MIIADTLRSLGLKAFAPGAVPLQAGPQYAWHFASERTALQIGDGSATSIAGLTRNWFFRTFPEAEPVVTTQDKKTGERVPIRPHPLTDLIEEPNPYYTGEALWAGLIVSYLFDGNGYWLKARNVSTRVAELYYAPHFLVEPAVRDAQLDGDHYHYTVRGVVYHIAPEDIVHVRFGIDSQNPRKGCSPIKEQLRELLTDEGAARFTASMLRNSAVPGIVVSPGAETVTFTEPAALATKAKFDQEFGGDNVGSTIVMAASTKVEQLGFSPEQLTLRDLRAIPEERFSAASGVPAAVLGLGSGLLSSKVGATMAEFREMAVESALVPMWRSFGRQVSRALSHEFNAGDRSQRLEFDTTEVRVLQPDRQLLHERTRLDVAASIITVATSQARLGYPVDATQDVYLRSPLIVEVPATAQPSRQRQRNRNGKSNGKLTQAQQAGLNFVRAIDVAQAPIVRAFEAALAQAFDNLGAAASAAYINAPKGRKQDPADAPLVDNIIGTLDLDREAQVRFEPMYGASYEATARIVIGGVEELLGATLEIGVRDAIAERVLAEGGRRVGLLDLSQQTRDALFRALEDARARGLGIPETARLIRDQVGAGRYVNAGAQYRATTIARTEMTYARNISTLETGRAAGFEQYLAFDNRTGFEDAECVARNGETFSADQMLGESGNEHPRGTLSFSPVPKT